RYPTRIPEARSTRPPSGSSRPHRMRISVVLPTPLGPTKPTFWPARISSESSSSTGSGPKCLVNPAAVSRIMGWRTCPMNRRAPSPVCGCETGFKGLGRDFAPRRQANGSRFACGLLHHVEHRWMAIPLVPKHAVALHHMLRVLVVVLHQDLM